MFLNLKILYFYKFTKFSYIININYLGKHKIQFFFKYLQKKNFTRKFLYLKF